MELLLKGKPNRIWRKIKILLLPLIPNLQPQVFLPQLPFLKSPLLISTPSLFYQKISFLPSRTTLNKVFKKTPK
ncbi:MAG: hypothetical protein COV69_04080 [Parcubacteria group bacterium CG11_big_fil_rev_8_21_14_0_20_39_14]|nr:MAG: hypothetical protein COV69_04080 [Parcubacteria group bacterium CG11_big_fil_rev_8_21_14_0_20_39_14]PIS35140.1 MAG: hypothetical protein COT36_04280 [Parcubacteria group bacterium CG08_land_8_20_14_0_20_38_56]